MCLPRAPPSPSLPTTTPKPTGIAPLDHPAYLRLALSYAHESPPLPTNFRVGAILLDERRNTILATGYTLELPGNTHAEQCCLAKYAAEHNVSEDKLHEVLPEGAVIYTTVEPCVKRLSGNKTCVERICETRREVEGENGVKRWEGGVGKVYVGVAEPETFVGKNGGRAVLEGRGIKVVVVGGMEEEILWVATAGHGKKDDEEKEKEKEEEEEEWEDDGCIVCVPKYVE